MSPYEEEDFELVLGNRQLFFLAVVLFGLFFSIGYTVGYGRGRNSSDDVSAATQEPNSSAALAPVSAPPPVRSGEISPSPDSPLSPDVASGSAPSLETSAAALDATRPGSGGEPAQAVAKAPSESSLPGVDRRPASQPTTEAASNSGARELTPAMPIREMKQAERQQPAGTAPDTSSEVSTVAVAEIIPGNIYLQVLASREAEPARKALREFKAKGHPVALDNIDPAWYRILVGPFSTREAADAYMARLKSEGYPSFLRKF